MTIFASNAHSQFHVHIYVCIFIWQSTCSYKSMCITYCIVTCSCISITSTLHAQYMSYALVRMHLYMRAHCTFVLFINMQHIINDGQNSPNLWSYNSSFTAALNPHMCPCFCTSWTAVNVVHWTIFCTVCFIYAWQYTASKTAVAMCTQYTAMKHTLQKSAI